jgi:hypothetical protein
MFDGVALVVQMEQGQFTGWAVVNSHDASDDIGVPEVFLMPLLPPLRTALYELPAFRAELGSSVTVLVVAL